MPLSDGQQDLLDTWMPGLEIVEDMGWQSFGTTVLHVRHGRRDLVVKAGGADNHHIGREIAALTEWRPFLGKVEAPRLVHADPDQCILVLTYLTGTLVEGHEAEWLPGTYEQAGRLLAALHGGATRDDDSYWSRTRGRAEAWLDGDHAIEPATEAALRAALRDVDPTPVSLVPTHGDWQPLDEGVVKVIDFGRADWRPALTDVARLAAQQFRGRSELEAAFFEGYGGQPPTGEGWRLTRLGEAIGTACWAHRVGDQAFEAQGHRMVAEVLAADGGRG